MAEWLTRLADSETNLLVCNGPCRSCNGVIAQSLQIQLFLARAAAAPSLVSPVQERWNAVWQLLQVRGLILQVMLLCSSHGVGVLGGSALVVVSERSTDQPLFPRGGFVGDAVDTTNFPGGWRGRCISLQSEQGVDSRGLIPTRIGC